MDVPDTTLGVWLADSVDGGTSGAGAVCPGIAVSSRGRCETKQEQVIIQTTAPAIWIVTSGERLALRGLGKVILKVKGRLAWCR